MKLTKKEILENLNSLPASRVFFERKYEGTIRSFFFETDKDDLYETDEEGKMTFVDKITNGKRGVVTSIYNWFKQYASQELD